MAIGAHDVANAGRQVEHPSLGDSALDEDIDVRSIVAQFADTSGHAQFSQKLGDTVVDQLANFGIGKPCNVGAFTSGLVALEDGRHFSMTVR
jgi:hypothetical protein